MGVGGTGAPGSGWSHLGFWSLLTASWTWPKSRYPEPPSPSPFEVWPKAAAGQVLGPAVMSEGPSSPKGESTAFSRVGFSGSREASSHPCGRLQEREVPSTEGGAPSGPAPPARPHRPPPCGHCHLRSSRAVRVSHRESVSRRQRVAPEPRQRSWAASSPRRRAGRPPRARCWGLWGRFWPRR